MPYTMNSLDKKGEEENKNCIRLFFAIFSEDLKKNKKDLLDIYYGKARFLPSEYSSLTDTIVFKDTVILLLWTANPPIGAFVKDRDNAETCKKQFKLLWKHAKK